MSAVLLDTHAWIWSLMDSTRLTKSARAAIVQSDSVHVSPVSLFEITQKVRLGKWLEIEPHIDTLVADEQALSAPFNRAIAARAGMLGWSHRDPFDRLIAATAVELKCPLISKDGEFDSLARLDGWKGRIWS